MVVIKMIVVMKLEIDIIEVCIVVDDLIINNEVF